MNALSNKPDPGRQPSRRTVLGASILLSPLALAACGTGATRAPLSATPPPALPSGLREGEQRPWAMPDASAGGVMTDAPYPRMLMAIPSGYAASTQPWPLLVFLHGAGERGTDLEDVKRNGPPMLIDKRPGTYPMIVCSPQVDPLERWQPRRLHALVASLSRHFAIDQRRVVATGLSMGGGGAWRWACEYPGDLAAIVPICGSCDPSAVASMQRVPVRAYHGDQDEFVPLAHQQACVAELHRLGGQASLTVYKGMGHASWVPAYEDPELVPWMLGQTRA